MATKLCDELAASLPASLRLLHITTACHLKDYAAIARCALHMHQCTSRTHAICHPLGVQLCAVLHKQGGHGPAPANLCTSLHSFVHACFMHACTPV